MPNTWGGITDQEVLEKAFQKAVAAQKRAYAPYSDYPVGVCIGFKEGALLIEGSNIENSVNGVSHCAERSAVSTAISAHGKRDFNFIVVLSKTCAPCCGVCLQLFDEFCDNNFEIYLAHSRGIQKKYIFKDLLPHRYENKDLMRTDPPS